MHSSSHIHMKMEIRPWKLLLLLGKQLGRLTVSAASAAVVHDNSQNADEDGDSEKPQRHKHHG